MWTSDSSVLQFIEEAPRSIHYLFISYDGKPTPQHASPSACLSWSAVSLLCSAWVPSDSSIIMLCCATRSLGVNSHPHCSGCGRGCHGHAGSPAVGNGQAGRQACRAPGVAGPSPLCHFAAVRALRRWSQLHSLPGLLLPMSMHAPFSVSVPAASHSTKWPPENGLKRVMADEHTILLVHTHCLYLEGFLWTPSEFRQKMMTRLSAVQMGRWRATRKVLTMQSPGVY